MSREDLINTARAILARAGFDISPALNLRSVCFDVVGRKGTTLLIIKILSNVDAFSRDNADEMKILAEALKASPLLIGERSSSGPLEPGIVYTRFNIPIVSNDTLAEHLLKSAPPMVFAAPGGLYVRLDSDTLKEIRETNGISLGTLAEIAGVSRRTIQMYETGMGAMIDAAIRLEEALNIPLIEPIDPFEYKGEHRIDDYELTGDEQTDSVILKALMQMGFSVTPVTRSPFDALTRSSEMMILTGIGSDEERLVQKATIVSDISRISGKHAVIIVDRNRGLENVKNTAVVGKDELNKIDDKNDLTDLVLSRSSRK